MRMQSSTSRVSRRIRGSLLIGTAILTGSVVVSGSALAQTTSAGPFNFPTPCFENPAVGELTCGAGSVATGTNNRPLREQRPSHRLSEFDRDWCEHGCLRRRLSAISGGTTTIAATNGIAIGNAANASLENSINIGTTWRRRCPGGRDHHRQYRHRRHGARLSAALATRRSVVISPVFPSPATITRRTADLPAAP